MHALIPTSWRARQVPATIEEGPSAPPSVDSTAFNALIAPLTVGPLRIKGVVWYQVRSQREQSSTHAVTLQSVRIIMQGENNVAQGGPEYYSCALPALMADWRAQFKQPDLFFGIMQVGCGARTSLPNFRKWTADLCPNPRYCSLRPIPGAITR